VDARLDSHRLRAVDDQLAVYNEYGAHWTMWTYKDIHVMGWVQLDPQSDYIRLIRPVLQAKQTLATDFWMGWIAPTPVKQKVYELAQMVESALEDESIDSRGNRTYLAQAALSGYTAGLMQGTYAHLFQGMTAQDIERVTLSFALENCRPTSWWRSKKRLPNKNSENRRESAICGYNFPKEFSMQAFTCKPSPAETVEKVGVILPHEHLFTDLRPTRPGCAQGTRRQFMISGPHLAQAERPGHRAGMLTGVDATFRCGNTWQSAPASRSSPHRVYREAFIPTAWLDTPMEVLADAWIADLTEGIDGTPIRAGFIKIAMSDDGPRGAKCATAGCRRASLATGGDCQPHHWRRAGDARDGHPGRSRAGSQPLHLGARQRRGRHGLSP
jgi:hypothetical protein